MLSLKNGGMAPQRAKDPLLALMTPRLRSLFEGTVEPVLDLLRYRDEHEAKERAKALWDGALATNNQKLGRAQAHLERLSEDNVMRPYAQADVNRLKTKIAKDEKKLDAARKATSKLRSKVASISKRKALGPALTELEAPIFKEADAAAAAPASSAAASASASSSAAVPPASSSSSAPKKKKQKKAPTTTNNNARSPPPPAFPLVELLTQYVDPASIVLGFVGGCALKGIGSTAPALRTAVQDALPSLSLKVNYSQELKPVPSLQVFPRLQELSVRGYGVEAQHALLAAEIASSGQLTRLRGFSSQGGISDVYIKALLSLEWPQLRSLGLGSGLGAFLDGVAARPELVFPSLRFLDVYSLAGEEARKLALLLERGAFPSLAALRSTSALGVAVESRTDGDVAHQVAVLLRLPETAALRLTAQDELRCSAFTGLLLDSRLANLKHLTLSSASNTGHDATCLWAAISSGTLPRLEHLHVLDSYQSIVVGQVDALPNSLPRLRSIRVDAAAPHALLAGLFTAAGANLSTLHLHTGVAATAAMRLVAQQDYPWLSTLRELSLKWKTQGGGWGVVELGPQWEADTAEHTAAALGRLSSLKMLTLEPRAYDELVVRLLVLGESGGLPNLEAIQLLALHATTITNGAVLLLLMWLKREAVKALEGGQGPAVVWDVRGLPFADMHASVTQICSSTCSQLVAARKRVV